MHNLKNISFLGTTVHSTKHKNMEQLCKHSFIPSEVNNGMAKTLAAEGNIVTIPCKPPDYS
jgi:hypothetical protein